MSGKQDEEEAGRLSHMELGCGNKRQSRRLASACAHDVVFLKCDAVPRGRSSFPILLLVLSLTPEHRAGPPPTLSPVMSF